MQEVYQRDAPASKDYYLDIVYCIVNVRVAVVCLSVLLAVQARVGETGSAAPDT